ncbi:hypothetical protein PV327_009398 [Microctonus hyperodae]|uniref:Uncharacterized protein n=1 Tax=Microctonus hyperodae TaxID=165561 RepID=A0AA39FUA7_MICHY|nr:hypothetical protein PV327_009398 [Microctonus hyperodae]
MGARHSKRSMDVTSTPKKEGLSAEGGDAPTIGDGKLERIEEIDAKPTTNGVAPHIDTPEEKDIKDKDSATEKEKDKNVEETKEAEETKVDTQAESPTEGGENVTTPTEETVASPTSVTSPETKESKKKDKPKKKWSFRSISFSKKDKNKPVREETPKNGDVSKDEPLTEGGEDAENAVVETAETAATAAPPEVNGTEETTPSTSPTESSSTPVVDAKEDDKSALPPPQSSSGVTAEANSIDDKNKATVAAAPSSPIAPTPVPVDIKNDEAENEGVEKKTCEVSPVQAVAIPVEVTTHTQPIVTSSIIERKTSEEFHSLFPSSPPPTPIDPSPIQKAQQAAANADALAEALKFPTQTIKQSQNNSCIANDQENSNSIIENNENIIENHPKANQVTLDIADVPENASELKALEEQNKQQSTLVSTAIFHSDLVIQTEEGPIPISNNDIEVEIESVINITDKDVEKIVEQISDIPKIINNSSEIIVDTDEISADNELLRNESGNDMNIDEIEDDIPPPLPDSPIPMPKTKTDLLSFMTSQIEDSSTTLTNIIKIANPQSSECADTTVDEIELQNKLCDIADSSSDNLPQPQNVENSPLPLSEVPAYEIIQESNISNPETPAENTLTPPLSPILMRCQSNIKYLNTRGLMDPVPEKHYIEVNEAFPLDSVPSLQDMLDICIEQSTIELEPPMEINSDLRDGLTDTLEDEPNKELLDSPIAPTSKGPMITEDVASVTKAVEEIDISEKAVAAAVNENIECITKNEIIAEMNHQNNLNE